MQLKKFLLFGLIAAVLPAFAEEAADRKTATSLKYVTHELDTRQNKFTAEANKAMEYTDSAGTVQKRAVKSDLGTSTTDTSLPMVGGVNTKLNQKQDDIDPVNDHTAVTYTGQSGNIGQKGIYQTTESYAAQSDNLIDAKTFNAALKNGLDSEFLCSDNRQPGTGTCWLWEIHTNTGHGLPDGYTELEYIRFTGEQWLDTDFIMQQSANPKVELVITNKTGSAFGAQSDNTRALLDYTSQIYCGSGSRRLSYTLPSNDNQKHTLTATYISETGNLTISVDGTVVNSGVQEGSFPTNTTYYIGKINGGSTSAGLLSGNVYRVSIYQNNNIIVNLVPAKNAQGIIGMYDTANNTFLVNHGTDSDFVAGPELGVYIPQNQ